MRRWSMNYSYFQSGSSGCLMSHRGRRLLTAGSVAKLYSGGGEGDDHSGVHASHGSLPAGLPLSIDHRRMIPEKRTPAVWTTAPNVTMRFTGLHQRPWR